MRVNLGPTFLLLMAACTGLPFFGRQSPPSPDTGTTKDADAGRTTEDVQVPSRVVLEIQDIQYDGLTLSGRILISPEVGKLRLDKRLLPTIDVNIGRVSSCISGQPVTFIRADAFAPLADPEDLLILDPGYWYGASVRLRLFSEHFTGLGPECIDADLSLLSFDGEPVALQRIRALRTLPRTMDGGMGHGVREQESLPQWGDPHLG